MHVEGRHSPQRRHMSVETSENGLGFLQRGVRYVRKWTPIPNVESVASEESRQLIVLFDISFDLVSSALGNGYLFLFLTSTVLCWRKTSTTSGIGLGISDVSLIALGIGCYFRRFRRTSKKRKKTERGRG